MLLNELQNQRQLSATEIAEVRQRFRDQLSSQAAEIRDVKAAVLRNAAPRRGESMSGYIALVPERNADARLHCALVSLTVSLK